MKLNNITSLKKIAPIICVVSFAIYPIIALYAHNVEELTIRELIIPVILSVVLSILLFGFWIIIFKNQFKSSIATVIFLILFWNYDLLYSGIIKIANLEHWHFMPLLIFLYLYLNYFISKIKKQATLSNLNTILLFPITSLIIINLAIIIPSEIKKNSYQPSKTKIDPVKINKHNNNPDIYLIIFDEYASLGTIKKEWGYDNRNLKDFLEGKGFYIPEHSEVRNIQTIWNIAGLLNLDYIVKSIDRETYLKFLYDPDDIKGTKEYNILEKINFNEAIEKINNNVLISYLKTNGYRIEILEGISHAYMTLNIKNVDYSYSYPFGDKPKKYKFYLDVFYTELIKKTMFSPFEVFFTSAPTDNINYSGTKYILSYLNKNTIHHGSPRFVYCHIMCPHTPYVFDRFGNYTTDYLNDNTQNQGKIIQERKTVNDAYLDQYIYVSSEIKKISESIIENGQNKPVIIIQSDHGPRPHTVYLNDKFESFRVFNAVYFPDGDYKKLYDSIAPINTLRVMLNKYFGETYTMLEDK